MKTYETDLREALLALLELIENPPPPSQAAEAHSGRVAWQLQLVDRLKSELPPDAPEMLRHFLGKRSYAKALDLLAARMPPDEQAAWKPACGQSESASLRKPA